MIDLSILIVSWNTKPFLKGCLQSLREGIRDICHEVFVVENASQDGSAEMIRDEFPEVSLLVNAENRGFAAANNQAVKLAKGRYVLFLNPDTLIHERSLDRMVRFMDEHPEAGAVGCKLLNADGTIQHSTRRVPTFGIMFYENTLLGRFFYFRGKIRHYKRRASAYDRVEEVDATSGAALMVRKSVLDEVGLMDERYFMFFEEMDLCRRIWAKGYKIYFMPEAVITHLGGESRRQNPEMNLVIQKSLMRYFRKFEGPTKTFLFKIIYKPLFIMTMICDLFFDLLHFWKYRTIRKDRTKLERRWRRVQRSLYFLKYNLNDFILNI